MLDNLPRTIAEGALTTSGVTLRTYVLEDGRRIINADDLAALFGAWGASDTPAPTEEETRALALFCRPAPGHGAG